MNAKAPLWTATEAEAATGGQLTRPWLANGVSIDSRTLTPGDLFIAIEGPRFDGHRFVADALAKGAAAAVVRTRPDGVGKNAPLLQVENTLNALIALADTARRRAPVKVVAITGSVGKTGAKDALHHVLSRQAACCATIGNLNNQYGLSLSLARMPRDTVYGVFEMGMNHAGEIKPLSRLARPDVAIITTITRAHSENFPSISAIAGAKAEIFAGMDTNGTAIVNRDNPFFHQIADDAERAGVSHILGFGAHPDAHARLVRYDDGKVRAVIGPHELCYRLGPIGRHSAINSLAVLTAVEALDADVDLAAAALADLEESAGRGKRHRLAIKGGHIELIDDSYNANPASMRAAFEVLAAAHPGRGGRRIAVLGDMFELGPEATALHAALAPALQAAKIDLVFTAGNCMLALHEALPASLRGAHADSAADLAPMIQAAVRRGDVVTVKGSHGMEMMRIITQLKDASRAGAATGKGLRYAV